MVVNNVGASLQIFRPFGCSVRPQFFQCWGACRWWGGEEGEGGGGGGRDGAPTNVSCISVFPCSRGVSHGTVPFKMTEVGIDRTS